MGRRRVTSIALRVPPRPRPPRRANQPHRRESVAAGIPCWVQARYLTSSSGCSTRPQDPRLLRLILLAKKGKSERSRRGQRPHGLGEIQAAEVTDPRARVEGAGAAQREFQAGNWWAANNQSSSICSSRTASKKYGRRRGNKLGPTRTNPVGVDGRRYCETPAAAVEFFGAFSQLLFLLPRLSGARPDGRGWRSAIPKVAVVQPLRGATSTQARTRETHV